MNRLVDDDVKVKYRDALQAEAESIEHKKINGSELVN